MLNKHMQRLFQEQSTPDIGLILEDNTNFTLTDCTNPGRLKVRDEVSKLFSLDPGDILNDFWE